MISRETRSRRRLVAEGLAWNVVYQVLGTALGFGAMLLLVRLIPPAEYGRAGVLLGLLALLNAASCGVFMAQALQLPDGEEPDWRAHWSAGFYIQLALMVACHALAAVCWLTATYRPIAPLLHLAAFGLLVDWPAQFNVVRLRRAMDLRRLNVLLTATVAVKLSVTIAAALAGGGALALVLGSNVAAAVPLALDLLVIQRWRPPARWWRPPPWSAYRPALRFGSQQMSSALLAALRGAVEAAVLPAAVGYPAIGLLNRAQALVTSTVARAGAVFVEAVYPMLPRSSGDPPRYARHATLLVQALLLIVVPGVLFVGLEGGSLLRLLYGARWLAAEPLIWPAVVASLGVGLFGAGSMVLLAANALRTCFALDVLAAAVSVPLVAVAWAGGGIVGYAWAAAAAQLVAGAVALVTASARLERHWIRSVALPPMVSTALASGAVFVLDASGLVAGPTSRLLLAAGVYVATIALSLRGLFPAPLASVIHRVPGGATLNAWLRLPGPPAELLGGVAGLAEQGSARGSRGSWSPGG